METKKIQLQSGIVITDARNLGCGIIIENQHTKYMTLSYSFENGFYLNIKGWWVAMDELKEYKKEFEMMNLLLIEVNKIFYQSTT